MRLLTPTVREGSARHDTSLTVGVSLDDGNLTHCFAAIAWASGRSTDGTMCWSTSSWQIERWLRYDSPNDFGGVPPQYWRIVR